MRAFPSAAAARRSSEREDSRPERPPPTSVLHVAHHAHHDHHATVTSEEQKVIEERCKEQFRAWVHSETEEERVERASLLVASHTAYLLKSLDGLPSGFTSLDASRPWIVYWSLHALELLGHAPERALAERVVDFLRRCQHPEGGFGGGPGQLAHLATTYAAVMALCIVGTEEALQAVNRTSLRAFLRRCKQADGSFAVCPSGEADARGAYCALAVATVTGLVEPQLVAGTGAWLARCQTYEGGFGAEPGNEAHCGYTYCALAAMMLVGEESRADLPALLRWAATLRPLSE